MSAATMTTVLPIGAAAGDGEPAARRARRWRSRRTYKRVRQEPAQQVRQCLLLRSSHDVLGLRSATRDNGRDDADHGDTQPDECDAGQARRKTIPSASSPLSAAARTSGPAPPAPAATSSTARSRPSSRPGALPVGRPQHRRDHEHARNPKARDTAVTAPSGCGSGPRCVGPGRPLPLPSFALVTVPAGSLLAGRRRRVLMRRSRSRSGRRRRSPDPAARTVRGAPRHEFRSSTVDGLRRPRSFAPAPAARVRARQLDRS